MKYLFAFLFSLFFTYALVPLNIKISNKLKLIDHPHVRRVHSNPTPIAGGLSFAIPIIIVQFISFLIYPQFGFELLYLTFGSILIILLGFLDDKTELGAKYKLFLQFILITLLFLSGFKIQLLTNPFGDDIVLGVFSYPLNGLK